MDRTSESFQLLVGTLVSPATDTAIATIMASATAGNIYVVNDVRGSASFGKTVDFANDALPARYYFIQALGDGKWKRSAGQYINDSSVDTVNVNAVAYTAPSNQTWTIAMDAAEEIHCNREFGLNLALENQEVYRFLGTNHFGNSYMVMSDACDECGTEHCSAYSDTVADSANYSTSTTNTDILSKLAAVINDDTRGLYTATLSTTGTPITAYNLVITVNSIDEYTFGNTPLNYFYPRQSTAVLSSFAGFPDTDAVFTSVAATYEKGSGYDVKKLEYDASIFDNGECVKSTLIGESFPIDYRAVVSTDYDLLTIPYSITADYSAGSTLTHGCTTIIAETAHGSGTVGTLMAALLADLQA